MKILETVLVMSTPQDVCSGPSALNKRGRGSFIKHMISARLVCSFCMQSTLVALHCCSVLTITQLHLIRLIMRLKILHNLNCIV